MRKMKRLFAGAFAAVLLPMLAVVTTSASAFEFLCGGEAITSSCPSHLVNLGIGTFEDRGSIPGKVECEPEAITSEGSITKPTEGETTSVTFNVAKCKASAKALNLKEEEVTNNCSKLEKVEAVNLPWTITLEEELTKLWWVLIRKTEAAEPGYKITCEAGGLKGIADTCIELPQHTVLILLENLNEAETIEGVSIHLLSGFFLGAPELLEPEEMSNCSLGGEHEGIVIGEYLIWVLRNEKAASLEIS